MKLKIHDYNLQQVAACLNGGYSEVWLHGSGDVFPVYVHDPTKEGNQDHSKNHAENFNTGHEENGYRVKINRSNMPKSVKDAELMLMTSKVNEDRDKEQKAQNPNARVTSVRVPETDFRGDVNEPAGDIDYSQFNRSAQK